MGCSDVTGRKGAGAEAAKGARWDPWRGAWFKHVGRVGSIHLASGRVVCVFVVASFFLVVEMERSHAQAHIGGALGPRVKGPRRQQQVPRLGRECHTADASVVGRHVPDATHTHTQHKKGPSQAHTQPMKTTIDVKLPGMPTKLPKMVAKSDRKNHDPGKDVCRAQTHGPSRSKTRNISLSLNKNCTHDTMASSGSLSMSRSTSRCRAVSLRFEAREDAGRDGVHPLAGFHTHSKPSDPINMRVRTSVCWWGRGRQEGERERGSVAKGPKKAKGLIMH